MGINIILPLIMGIAMTVIIGSQVAPNFIEQMKITKVENRTISNQNLIKDAIVRYIKMEGKITKDVAELKAFGLLRDYHEINLFDGGYRFDIDKKKGTLKIFTTINDDVAGKYFSNSFKFPNKANCVEIEKIEVNGVNVETCKDNLWETFYLLDEDTFKSIPIPEVGSIEWIEDKYSEDNLGDRYKETSLVGGEKDYVVDIPNNKIIEYTFNEITKEWDKTKEINGIEKLVIDNGEIVGVLIPTPTPLDNIKDNFPIVYDHIINGAFSFKLKDGKWGAIDVYCNLNYYNQLKLFFEDLVYKNILPKLTTYSQIKAETNPYLARIWFEGVEQYTSQFNTVMNNMKDQIINPFINEHPTKPYNEGKIILTNKYGENECGY